MELHCRKAAMSPKYLMPRFVRMFSICGRKFKGVFRSHRAHGSLRGRRCRLIMASGTGASKRSGARSPEFRRIDVGRRGHPASVPMGRLYTRTGVFAFWAISCRQLLFGPNEGCPVAPDAGHNDGQLSGRCNNGFLQSSSRDEPHGPCLER